MEVPILNPPIAESQSKSPPPVVPKVTVEDALTAPVLEMENKVVDAPLFEVEPMAKAKRLPEDDAR